MGIIYTFTVRYLMFFSMMTTESTRLGAPRITRPAPAKPRNLLGSPASPLTKIVPGDHSCPPFHYVVSDGALCRLGRMAVCRCHRRPAAAGLKRFKLVGKKLIRAGFALVILIKPKPIVRESAGRCYRRVRSPRFSVLVVGPIFSGIASCGGPTELRFFNSVGSSTFFGADRSPSTLCNNKRAAVAPT